MISLLLSSFSAIFKYQSSTELFCASQPFIYFVMACDAAAVAPPAAPPQDPSQQPGNVYYVHPSDGPSSVSITPVLNHSNYHSWTKSMRRPLGAKNKFDFVDGTIPVPNPFDPSYKAWCRCNMLIHSWIMNSVEESIAQSIVYLENVIDVWNELKERFSRGDFIRISELQIEIYGLKQGYSRNFGDKGTKDWKFKIHQKSFW
ncbi:uncharacterized protein LOC123908870 [Trifolium pratense]|uniref:Uncharacterized protein n=1 Tax=Trifolium pratense TaxID=57577 RepID=A0ACB0JVY4_TRIPR|nr:uncharacterized protein LOC123908870 [Trifolium pratense]CAJ2649025.1 unnamed protein product [Trifolium pratense]